MTQANKAQANKAQANKAQANKAQAIELTQAEQQAEQAAIALCKAGMADLIDAMLAKAGMATSEDEHKAARPQTAQEKAEAALQAIGLDLASLTPAKAEAGKLAVNLDTLAKAVGKYGRHAVICDVNNGTSLATHYMLNALAKAGRVTLADTLSFVRQHKPTYASAGHYNTIKSLLKKAGYRLNVAQGSFSISA